MEDRIGASEKSRVGILERKLLCIVKLGGAAVTCKHEIEKINDEGLTHVSSHLRDAMMGDSSRAEILGMDWSRRSGTSAIDQIDHLPVHQMPEMENVIIVHGAGSFGHFQASKSGVHKGGLHLPIVKAGFVATRISVTSLNLAIVKALARVGLPAIAMSPFACGWETSERNVAFANMYPIIQTLNAGFVPVLHGDAVLDSQRGCTILSGDVIIRHLAETLVPKYVVFLTDVLGVYDRPPSDPEAVLLREIEVEDNGAWSIVKPLMGESKREGVKISVAVHDTTGGMETKISEAAAIACLGIDVFIAKAGTDHALRALKGELVEANDEDWLGTAIRSAQRHLQ